MRGHAILYNTCVHVLSMKMAPNFFRTLKNKLEVVHYAKYARFAVSVLATIAFLHQLNIFISVSVSNLSETRKNSSSHGQNVNSEAIIIAKDEKLDSECQCKELLAMASKSRLCSDYSVGRGADQKVISTSYFRANFQELKSNAKAIATMYPGYYMRVYHNFSSQKHAELLCELFCQNDHIDLCDVTKLGKSNLLIPDITWYRNATFCRSIWGLFWIFPATVEIC